MNHYLDNMIKLIVLLIISLTSSTIHVYSQILDIDNINITTIDPNNFNYDDLILKKYNHQNNIIVSPNYYNDLSIKLKKIGKDILSLQPNDAMSVRSNIVTVHKNDYIGFVSLEGDVVISPKYKRANQVGNTDNWIVVYDTKYGLINPTLKNPIILDSKYQSLIAIDYDIYNKDSYVACIDNKWGIIDSLGNEIIPFEYDDIKTFQNNMFLVGKDRLFGFIDKENNIVIPLQYDRLKSFGKYRLAPARKDNKWGLIDDKGKFIVQPKYDDMFIFQEDMLKVNQNGKVGFLNINGKEIVKALYDDADAYSNDGVIRVKKKHKYGIINKKGKELTNTKYDYMSKFDGGCAMVALNNLVGVINNEGKEIIPFSENRIQINSSTIAIYNSETGEQQLYYHNNGKQVTQLSFDNSFPFEHHCLLVRKGNKCGIINKSGQIIVPVKFHKIEIEKDVINAYDKKQKISYMHNNNGELINKK